MRKILIYLIGYLIILSSCAPKISTVISKKYSPLDYKEDVKVFGLLDPFPANSEEIGVVKIGDSGFSTNCGWEVVIEKAKIEARKAGGNAIKITEHIPPSLIGSSCHRIKAKILKVTNFDDLPKIVTIDSSLFNADYALLHIYRNNGVGPLVNFDLHIGDTLLCRVENNWKKTIKIRKDGLNTIWARTEVKEEIPVNIKFGNEYYIRCSISMGAFVGHPKLELVNNQFGKEEYMSLQISKSNKRDLIIRNDGKEIECIINNEDNDNVYFTIFKNGKKIKTQINKAQIKTIQRSE